MFLAFRVCVKLLLGRKHLRLQCVPFLRNSSSSPWPTRHFRAGLLLFRPSGTVSAAVVAFVGIAQRRRGSCNVTESIQEATGSWAVGFRFRVSAGRSMKCQLNQPRTKQMIAEPRNATQGEPR